MVKIKEEITDFVRFCESVPVICMTICFKLPMLMVEMISI